MGEKTASDSSTDSIASNQAPASFQPFTSGVQYDTSSVSDSYPIRASSSEESAGDVEEVESADTIPSEGSIEVTLTTQMKGGVEWVYWEHQNKTFGKDIREWKSRTINLEGEIYACYYYKGGKQWHLFLHMVYSRSKAESLGEKVEGNRKPSLKLSIKTSPRFTEINEFRWL